jgi:hypothetical protein
MGDLTTCFPLLPPPVVKCALCEVIVQLQLGATM